MNNNIIAPIISAGKFQWDGNHGEAEASDLGFDARELPYYRLFNDSMDVGLILRSPKTGKEFIFYFKEERASTSLGYILDVIGWNFETSDGKYTLTVYND